MDGVYDILLDHNSVNARHGLGDRLLLHGQLQIEAASRWVCLQYSSGCLQKVSTDFSHIAGIALYKVETYKLH